MSEEESNKGAEGQRNTADYCADLFPSLPKTRTYVQPNYDGFPIASCGFSAIDGEDHGVSTYQCKADEVPEILMDAKTSAEYIAALINADLNNPDGIWRKHK
jgi:hypothetical protein